ncbi:MAG: flagellar hook-associated protein FlgL [Proteobacteria bacterium]|nr:flagellar hook-associated protein FlgL [Pseudomonadota bacterium]
MRVTNKMIYEAMRYRLGNLTSDLNTANEVVTTGNRINRLSDDPVGLTQVLDLKSSVRNIEQIDKNIQVGKNWLIGGETALTSISELIVDATVKTNAMINASADAPQRADMISHIDGIIQQIANLGNTQVNGSYIFSGSKTDTISFSLDNPDDPAQVTYNGDNTPFRVKSEKITSLIVGRNGEEVFWEDNITVDATNNTIVFMENTGQGVNTERVATATVPDGEYTKQRLAVAVRNAMNAASKESGYGVTYDVNYNEATNKFEIREDGTYDGYLGFQLMWETGYDARIENIDSGGRISPDDVRVTVNNYNALTMSTNDGEPMQLLWDGSEWQLTNDPGYDDLFGFIGSDPEKIELDLTGNGFADITIALANPATAYGDYISFDIVAVTNNTSIGPDLGFKDGDNLYSPAASDTENLFIPTPLTIDFTNNKIDFTEINSSGVATDLIATIPGGNYLPDDLAAEIETALELSSAGGNAIDYAVVYDSETGTFVVKEVGTTLNELHLRWTSGPNGLIGTTASGTIGYVNPDYASGSFGGDFMGALNWDAGDTVQMKISDGVNTLDYSRTISASDDNQTLLADLRTRLEAVFGQDATFTINGNMIDFDLDYNRTLTVSNLTDGVLNDAGIDLAVGNATGNIGGDLINNGWDVNDTIDITFTDGVNTLNYSHLVLVGEENSDIFNDLQAQLTATFGADATFTVNRDGIDYELSRNRVLNISPVTDDDGSLSGNPGRIERLDNQGTLLSAPNTGSPLATGEVASFFSVPGDDVLAFPISDNPVVLFTIDDTNNRINFEEFHNANPPSGELTITIPNGTYTRPGDLAYQIEMAMEAASAATAPPNNVDYNVYYDTVNRKFTIEEDAAAPVLNELHIYWNSGTDAAASAAKTLGYDNNTPATGSFGGDLLASGWDNGDTVAISFTDGTNLLSYTHTVDIASGDTTQSILMDLQARLESAFGTDATFALTGNMINFELANNRVLTIANTGDGFANDAALTLTGNVHSPAGMTIIGGNTADFYSVDDEIENTSYTSDNEPVLIVIDSNNNAIDFEEVDSDGILSVTMSIKIPEGNYSDLSVLAQAIESEMEAASGESGFGIDYEVEYNANTRRFTFKENGTTLDQLNLLWQTGENSDNSAASVLGFAFKDDLDALHLQSDETVIHIVIDNTNNLIDFKELVNGTTSDQVSQLTASIPTGTYERFEDLASAIEKAMEDESGRLGNRIDYSVTFDPETRKYTIKENGTTLDELDLLWQTGTHATNSAASILGFDAYDDNTPVTSSNRDVEWGIFNTLIDLKGYLLDNDVDGISRTLTRLDTHFNHIESFVADTGIRYNRLEIRESVSAEIKLTLTDRRASLEEADIVEAIMNLNALELTYEAALSSSAKILKLSLVDYL